MQEGADRVDWNPPPHSGKGSKKKKLMNAAVTPSGNLFQNLPVAEDMVRCVHVGCSIII